MIDLTNKKVWYKHIDGLNFSKFMADAYSLKEYLENKRMLDDADYWLMRYELFVKFADSFTNIAGRPYLYGMLVQADENVLPPNCLYFKKRAAFTHKAVRNGTCIDPTITGGMTLVDMFTDDLWKATNRIPSTRQSALNMIKNVIFSGPCTIVFWRDGTKTIVRCGKDDTFDREKGLAMAIAKYFIGNNNGYFNDVFKKWIPKEETD